MLRISSILTSLCLLAATFAVQAHGPAQAGAGGERHIEFPDTEAYRTLVLDLHTHSVFSDGHVWPTVRVSEALRDGLDGLAITEHLEFQPHIADIPHPDRNRAYLEALRAAEGHALKVIPGVEITRTDEPGHINAVFVQDANPLVKQRTKDQPLPTVQFETQAEAEAFAAQDESPFTGAHSVEIEGQTWWRPYADNGTYEAIMSFGLASSFDPRAVLEAANEQGAFLFWNHPNFEKTNSGLNKFHRSATKDGLLHGIEIANGDRYYPNAHRLALKHDLALIGVSDVHELIEWDYRPEAGENPGHRPVTLVLAEDDSLEAMKAALFARRTIVWWKETLIGREPHLDALLAASLSIGEVKSDPWGALIVEIKNVSDAPFRLQSRSKVLETKHGGVIDVAPNGVTEIALKVDDPEGEIELAFDVLNALTAPNETASIRLRVR